MAGETPIYNPGTQEIMSRIPVTAWRDGTILTSSNESTYLGAIYGSDSTGYFKYGFSGPYPVSRLSTVNQDNFQKLINDFGTIAASILIDESILISSSITIPANISLIKIGGADFTPTGGATVTVLGDNNFVSKDALGKVRNTDLYAASLSNAITNYMVSADGNVIYDLIDQYTGEYFTIKKAVTNTAGATITDALVDNALIFKVGSTYYLRTLADGIADTRWWGVKFDNTTDNAVSLQAAVTSCLTNKVSILKSPSGTCKFSATINFGDTSAVNNIQTSFSFIGQGMTSQSNNQAGGTAFLYTGASGAGTIGFNINKSFGRYGNFERLCLVVAAADGLDIGINFFTSTFSDFAFRNVRIANVSNPVKINIGDGANGEFTYFERCKFDGFSGNGFYCDAPQALSPKFFKTSFTPKAGATVFNMFQNEGGQITNCDISFADTSKAWANSTAYAMGVLVQNGGNIYTVTTAGTSAATGIGPSGTGTGITDGTVVYNWLKTFIPNTVFSIGGNVGDPIYVTGGRWEGVDRVVKYTSISDRNTLSISGTTFGVGLRTASPESAIDYGDATYLNLSKTYINDCIFYISTALQGIMQAWRINLPRASGGNGVVKIRNCNFNNLKPVLNGGLENLTAFANSTSQSNSFNNVILEDCWQQMNSGTAIKQIPINRTFVDNRPNNILLKEENYLLQSKFGETVTGTNVAAASPWVHKGTTLTFTSALNLTNSALPFGNISTGKQVKIAALSGIYQDITNIDITTAWAKLIKYEMLFSAYGSGSTNTLHISFSNSVTGKVYDEVYFNFSNNVGYKFNLTELSAYIPVSESGYLRLTIESVLNSSVTLTLSHQGITQSMNATPVVTSGSPVINNRFWEKVIPSLRVSDAFQLPNKDDNYGSSSSAVTESIGDIYLSQNTLTQKSYTDRWEEKPRQDINIAIPITGTWPKGFKRWNSAFDGGTTSSTVYWECIVAGSPGTWFAVTPAMLVGSNDIEITDSSKGIILKDSVDGSRKRITIASGSIVITAL